MLDTATDWRGVTPHGHPITMRVRPGTSDWNTVQSCNAADEYALPEGLSGWAMDVGAHIGALTVPLLVDNPGLRVVAIEALPENVVQLYDNLVLNQVEDRCVLIHAAASDSGLDVRIGYGEVADASGQHLYIGNANAPETSRFVSVKGVTLRGAMLTRGPDQDLPITWMKIDCEGCEYPFLSSPSIVDVVRIAGEVHFGWDRLVGILAATHDVTGPGKDFGPFEAVRR